MPYVTSFDQTNIYYHKSTCIKPKGTILFIHGGFFGNNTLLGKLHREFKQNYNIIAPDNRGRGRSSYPENLKNQTLEDYAKDAYKVLKQEKLKKVYVVGVSFGTIIAEKFVAMFGKEITIKKLVLVSSTYTTTFSKKNPVLRLIVGIIKVIVYGLGAIWPFPDRSNKYANYADVPELFFYPRYGLALVMNNSIKTFLKRYKIAFRLTDYEVTEKELEKISCPTLLVYGKKDKLFPYKFQEHILKHIKNSKINFIEDYSHNIHMHRTEKVAQFMKSFFKE